MSSDCRPIINQSPTTNHLGIVSLFTTTVGAQTDGNSLPLHLVWAVTLAEREGGGEVGDEELLLLDDGEDGLVDNLLVGGAGGRWHLLLWELSVSVSFWL